MTTDTAGARLTRRSNLALGTATLLWVAASLAATIQLWRYKQQPGPQVDAPPVWPVASRIAPDQARTTLLLFAHPMCPCTTASLGELRRLVGARDRVAGHVLFLVPTDLDDSWRENANWAEARSIPGVGVHEDRDGVEAARFGALTSGHVVAYASDGTLLFRGGITTARGHAGESPVVKQAIFGAEPTDSDTLSMPVFGCTLTDPK